MPTPEAALVVRMEATLARFERQLDQGRRKARQSSQEIEQDLSRVGRNFGQGINIQGFAQQMSQVGQSTQATGNFLQSLAIQLPDLALGFGPVGIAIGAVAGGLLTFASNMDLAGRSIEDIQEDFDDLEKATREAADAAVAAGIRSDDLVRRYGLQAGAVREVLEAELELANFRRDAALATATEDVQGALGAFTGRSVSDVRQVISLMGQLADEQQRADAAMGDSGVIDFDAQERIQGIRDQIAAFGGLDAEIEALARTTGETVFTSERLAAALVGVGEAISPEDKLAAWLELQQAFNETVDEGERLTEYGQQIAEFISQGVKNALALAGVDMNSNVSAAADSAQRFADVDMESGVQRVAAHAKDLATFLRDATNEANQMMRLQPGRNVRAAREEYQTSRQEGEAIRASSEAEAAEQGIIALIRFMEGTSSGRGYNTTLGNGVLRPEGSDEAAKPLTDMTLQEIFNLQKQMLANPRNRELYGEPSSALGLPQIVGSTLFGEIFSGREGAVGIAQRLGLSMDDKFSVDVQNRILEELVRMRAAQGGDTVENFRDEWEGLRETSPENILRALQVSTTVPPSGGEPQLAPRDPTTIRETESFISGAESALDRADADAARETARLITDAEQAIEAARRERVREEEELAREAERLDEQEAARLADLAMDRVQANRDMQDAAAQRIRDQEFEASLIGKTAEEIVGLRTAYTLLNQARAAGVDLNDRVGESEKTVGELIHETAIAAMEGARAQADLNNMQEHTEERNAFIAAQWQDLKNGILDAIVAGDSFTDTLSNIAQALGRATLEAALFGTGPFSQSGNGAGGLAGLLGLGSLFAPRTMEGGGYTWSGPRAGGVDGRGGRYAILHPNESVIDHTTGTGGGGEVGVRVWVDDDARLHAAVERAASRSTQRGLAAYDSKLPGRVKGINRDPRRR